MNNSKIAIENVSLELEEDIDVSPSLRQKATELAQEIEAIEQIQKSKYWGILAEKIYLSDLGQLHLQLGNEKDSTEIYRLQGKISWIEKNLDLTKLVLIKRNELARIRTHLNAKDI